MVFLPDPDVNNFASQNPTANIAEALHQGPNTHFNPTATEIKSSANTQNPIPGQMLSTHTQLLLEGPLEYKYPTSKRSESSEGPWEENDRCFPK